MLSECTMEEALKINNKVIFTCHIVGKGYNTPLSLSFFLSLSFLASFR